jgi:hypothetical protein
VKMKMFVLSLAATLACLCTIGAHAQTGPALTVVPFNGQFNPCQNPSVTKTSVGVALAAGTHQLVAAVAGQKVYVCGFVATFAGTTPALTFITGMQTTTACDTGAANLSGAFLPTSGTFVNMAVPGAIAIGAASGQVCALTVGSIQGVMTYAQY